VNRSPAGGAKQKTASYVKPICQPPSPLRYILHERTSSRPDHSPHLTTVDRCDTIRYDHFTTSHRRRGHHHVHHSVTGYAGRSWPCRDTNYDDGGQWSV